MLDPELPPPGFVDLQVFRRCAWQAYDDTYEHRELVNSLNFFPVADFDTGDALSEFWAGFASSLLFSEHGAHLGQSIASAAQRNSGIPGNSATILCAWLTGLGIALYDIDRADAYAFADALQDAARAARGAVLSPVPGTMLTVYDAVAEAVSFGDERSVSFAALFRRLPHAIEAALNQFPVPVAYGRTMRPDQDAGAFAMRLMFHALKKVLAPGVGEAMMAVPQPSEPETEEHLGRTLQHGVEVHLRVQIPTDSIEEAKGGLADLGNSLVVALEPTADPHIPPVWNIHLHTGDPDAAAAFCAQYGRILRTTSYPIVPGIRRNPAPGRDVPAERQVLVITDAISRDEGFSGARVVHTSDIDEISAYAQHLVLGSQMVIVAIGAQVGPIAEKLAARAREAARRSGAHIAITVVPAPSLTQAHAAIHHHQSEPLGKATLRIYEAMHDPQK